MDHRTSSVDHRVSAVTIAVAIIVSLLPSLWLAAIMLPRFLFARSLAQWNRGLFEWVPSSPEAKVFVLATYALAFAATIGALIVVVALKRNASALERLFGSLKLRIGMLPGLTIGATGIVGLALFACGRPFLAFGMCGISLGIFALICIFVLLRERRRDRIYLGLASAAVLIGVAPLCYALIYTPFRVPNEFLSLPEVTVFPDGERVDNIDFINSRQFEGLRIPDPRKGAGSGDPFVIKVNANETGALRKIRLIAEKEPERFWFDRDEGRLEIHGPLLEDDYELLSPFVSDAEDRNRLKERFAEDIIANIDFSDRKYDRDERAFLKINRPELDRQLVLGRFFYHHFFLFLPALSGVLDGHVTSASQYGRGLTIFFSKLLKFSPEHLRFNSYLLWLYSSYLIYLVVLLILAARFGFGRWGLVFIGAFAVLSYLIASIETTRLGVGLAPWRHFFDIVAMFLLFSYLSQPRKGVGIALVAVLGFSIYWSREMGLFLAVGIIFALVAHAVVARVKLSWQLIAACAVSTAMCWRLGDPHAPENMTITLLGINTPSIPSGFIQLLAGGLVLCGLGWLVFSPRDMMHKDRYVDWIVLGGVLGYVASSSIYLIWYPRPHHLIPILPMVGLAGALIYRSFVSRRVRHDRAVAAVGIASVMLAVALLGILRSLELWRESTIFQNHVVYDWKFPDGQITSTGEPKLLDQSIKLIRSYEPGSAVNIMSPWEVVLLPFAGKYKSGPYSLSIDSLLSSQDVERLAEFYVSSPSRALFIDSRIMEGEYENALSDHAYIADRILASKLRIRAHTNMRYVFQALKPCYERVSGGQLISVFMRKRNARWVGGECRANGE